MVRTWYNGYKFAPEAKEMVYNPTLAIFFLKKFHDSCSYPRKMLDSNLAMDAAKLEYISQIPYGRQLLLSVMREKRRATVTELHDRFGIREMLANRSKDSGFMVSFLYFFGVLTLSEITATGKLELKIPNLAIRRLYADRIQEMLLPEPRERDDGVTAAEKLYQEGDMGPLCQFVEQRYFKVFRNPGPRAGATARKSASSKIRGGFVGFREDLVGRSRRRGSGLKNSRPTYDFDRKSLSILSMLAKASFLWRS